MTRDEFLDAAAKGKGRAVLALRSGEYRPSFHDMRRLTLRWPGFDFSQECSRGGYTIEMIDSSGFDSELKALVIRHLSRKKGWRGDRGHRTAIVLELAKLGAFEAKDALYANFDPSDDFRLADEIIELDGLAGLDWVISHSSAYMADEDPWRFKWWIDDLRETIGSETVSKWLDRESAARPEIAEFASLANREPKGKSPGLTPIAFEEFRHQWLNSGDKRISVWAWSRTAKDAELERAWRAFEVDEDPKWLHQLAIGLRRKPKHCDVDRIIERARSWRQERNPFVMALDERSDPRLRTLGFDLIDEGWIVDGIGALSWSAEPDDVPTVLEAAGRLTEKDDLHWAALDLLTTDDLLKDRSLLLWVYEYTPCSFCRETAFRHLVERHEAPEAMVQECLFDCDPEAREQARRALDSLA